MLTPDLEALIVKTRMKTWRGINLPEVPPEFRWKESSWPLVLHVVGKREKKGFTPVVLWVKDYDSIKISIAPLGTEDATWEIDATEDVEAALHTATTRVLLGMWED